MKKYQVVEVEGDHQHAGTKATSDIKCIAESLGYQSVFIKMNTTEDTKKAKVKRQIGYYHDWNAAYNNIEMDSIVLLQHPFHNKQLTREKILLNLKEKKYVKYISIIHDIEQLRKFRYNGYYKHEYEFMKRVADVIVCHNDIMKKFLVQDGIEEDKIIVLKIFDYLQNNPLNTPRYEKSITVAGNLDVTKCGYISELSKLKNIDIQLYGPNFNQDLGKYSNIHYHGSFPPDEIPNQLTSGFGLVWDGTNIDGCKGDSGQYLRYNNPHKLSLYLSSGLPVILWKEAAEAKFVSDNNIGICVDSLYELETIFDSTFKEDYMEIVKNVQNIAKRLQKGEYGKIAIQNAEKKIFSSRKER